MMLPFFKVWGQLGYEPLIFNCTVLKHNEKNPLSFFLALGSGLPMVILFLNIYFSEHFAKLNVYKNPNLIRFLGYHNFLLC